MRNNKRAAARKAKAEAAKAFAVGDTVKVMGDNGLGNADSVFVVAERATITKIFANGSITVVANGQTIINNHPMHVTKIS